MPPITRTDKQTSLKANAARLCGGTVRATCRGWRESDSLSSYSDSSGRRLRCRARNNSMTSLCRWSKARIVVIQILLLGIVLGLGAFLGHATVLCSSYWPPAYIVRSGDSIRTSSGHPSHFPQAACFHCQTNQQRSTPSPGLEFRASRNKRDRQNHSFNAEGEKVLGALLLAAALIASKP